MRDQVRLVGDTQRAFAKRLVDEMPIGWIVKFVEPTRTNDQNARMHAMLADVSRAEPMGRKHTPDDWKAIFMNACGWECQFTVGLDGRPFPQGFRSSRLTVKQMSNLIEYIFAFGAEHGVAWSEPTERKAA